MLAVVAAATLVAVVGGGGPAAHAAVGAVPAGAVAAATVRVDIAGDADAAPGELRERSCSGALVSPRWVVTAASCFADSAGAPVAEGFPTWATTATIGRTDLTGSTGLVVGVDLLVPHPERDVVLVRLATAVAGVAPVAVARTAPAADDTLTVAGHGRTADAVVPDVAHSATYRVTGVGQGVIDIAPSGAGAAICKGDAGGPALRATTDGGIELVAIHHTAFQGGCLGSADTRREATETRVDDLRAWIALHTLSQKACATAPAVSASTIGNGTLVRTPDGTISVVAGGAKYPLTYAQWSAMGLRGYTDVTAEAAAALVDVPRDGTFLRDMETGAIHQVVGGARYLLASVAEWRAIGSPAYVDVPAGFIERVADLAPAGPVLLRDPETGEIHQVVGCSRYLLTAGEWQALGSPAYVQAPASLIGRVPVGAPTAPAFLRDRTDGGIYQALVGARYRLTMAEWTELGRPAYTEVPPGLLARITGTVPQGPVLLRDVASGTFYEVAGGVKRQLTQEQWQALESQAAVAVPAGWLERIPNR